MYSFNDKSEITEFIKANFVTSAEAAKILTCSRANISDLLKRGKLLPAVELSQTILFWRDDIESRQASSPKAGRPTKREGD